MMKSKITLCLLALVWLVMLSCGSSKNDKGAPELSVPAELKDSAVLEADEAGALEKLNNVIDSTNKEHK